MSDTVENKKDKVKISKLVLVVTFCFSFVFFLYLTFPYNVLKEVVSQQMSRQMRMSLVIGDLSPSFPLGLSVQDVKLSLPRGGGDVFLEEIDLSLSLLSLVMGKVGADLDLGSGKGTMSIHSSLSLLGIFSQDFTPRQIELEASDFPVDGLATFGIAMAADSPGMNELLKDFIRKLKLGGLLNGKLELNLDPNEIGESSGQMNLSFKRGYFELDDATLNLSRQAFKRAAVKANLSKVNGKPRLTIDKASGFVSQELDFLFSGFMDLRQPMNKSFLQIDVNLALRESLKREIGPILEFALGAKDGQSKFQLRGPLNNISRVTL